MSIFYLAAGINHLIHPNFYLGIMPPWLPFHHAVIVTSGVCEILFAVLLLLKATRKFAAWGIIAFLIAVFPANIQMVLNYEANDNPALWLAISRLPLQLLLIWWAYTFTKEQPKTVEKN